MMLSPHNARMGQGRLFIEVGPDHEFINCCLREGMTMRKTIVAAALTLLTVGAHAQHAEDCTTMANRWSDVFSNAPAVETMTGLFLPNALVFGTQSKELGTSSADVVAYFTPVFARKFRTKNTIKSQS